MNQRPNTGQQNQRPARLRGCNLCQAGWLYYYEMQEPYTHERAARAVTISVPCTCPDGETVRLRAYAPGVTFHRQQVIATKQAITLNQAAQIVGDEVKRRWIAEGTIPLVAMLTELLGGIMKNVSAKIATPTNSKAKALVEEMFTPSQKEASDECQF